MTINAQIFEYTKKYEIAHFKEGLWKAYELYLSFQLKYKASC